MTNKETEKLVLSINEAAKALGCSKGLIRRLIKSKEIKAFKVGNRYRVYSESIKNYMKKNEV